MVNMLKMGGPGQGQPGSPQSHLNGPPSSQSNTATSSNPQMGAATARPPSTTESWTRQSPSRQNEPLVRPVQQILSSPVDKWGLKALLYEIRTQMGKGDRGMLMFGEDLQELGMDIQSSDPLYSTFVTPWVDPTSMQHPPQIEDMFVIPSCYHVVPPPVESKLPNFAEETLFYIFYSAPQDIVQLMVAEELYNRGWRFSTDLRVWITSGPLSQIDLHGDQSSQPSVIRGPFSVFNPATWSRQDTGGDFTVELSTLEATRPAAAIVQAERAARKDQQHTRSPNGASSAVGNTQSQQHASMQAAH